MTQPHSPRGPRSTIAGWMVAIAVIGVALGIMIVAPIVFVPVVFVVFETVAILRFSQSRRRKPMSGWALAAWIVSFLIVIPIVSLIASLTTLYIYCSVNPNALQ